MAISQIGKRISFPCLPRGNPRDKTGNLFADIAASTRRERRPWITLTYAQSLDGCIAARPGHGLTLSSRRSLALTHRLRAAHDAILVGIGTVLADNPRLTVRLAPGEDPQPVVLDSQLRFPVKTPLLQEHPKTPWIVTGKDVEESRQRALETAGAEVVRLSIDPKGHIELRDLLQHLLHRGIHRLMVEGGAHVITSFLSNRMVDRLVLTLTPLLLGGLRAVGTLSDRDEAPLPRLHNLQCQWLGEDIVLWGDPIWEDE
jgi:GTP cyclohydrolase II